MAELKNPEGFVSAIDNMLDKIAMFKSLESEGGLMAESLREKIAKELNDWYEEPNWLVGDFPILANNILHLVAEEVERMPKVGNPHAHEVNIKTPDIGMIGLASGFIRGREAERANIVRLIKEAGCSVPSVNTR